MDKAMEGIKNQLLYDKLREDPYLFIKYLYEYVDNLPEKEYKEFRDEFIKDVKLHVERNAPILFDTVFNKSIRGNDDLLKLITKLIITLNK
jgi:hypothetical protein